MLVCFFLSLLTFLLLSSAYISDFSCMCGSIDIHKIRYTLKKQGRPKSKTTFICTHTHIQEMSRLRNVCRNKIVTSEIGLACRHLLGLQFPSKTVGTSVRFH